MVTGGTGFFTMVHDNFDGGELGEACECRAGAEQVADFVKLQWGSVHLELNELIDGICERAPETLGAVKGNTVNGNAGKSKRKCQIQYAATGGMRASSAQTSRMSSFHHIDSEVECMIASLATGISQCVTTVVVVPMVEYRCFDKLDGKPHGRRKLECGRCCGYGHDISMRRSTRPRPRCPLILHRLCRAERLMQMMFQWLLLLLMGMPTRSVGAGCSPSRTWCVLLLSRLLVGCCDRPATGCNRSMESCMGYRLHEYGMGYGLPRIM